MGQVFLGLSPGGRKVAVKLIRPEYASSPQFRRRFMHEVAAAGRVGGFHTAQVVDADTAAQSPWLVTAFIEGPSLHEAVSTRGPLPAGEVKALAAGLAEGLAAIHDCGLVHRDLKPGNVIMAVDGPRIIDFGIAQVADAGAVTTAGTVVGTFSFMSPEQIRADRAGPAGDVFSLGCVLAFAATGRSPFAAASIPAIAHRVLSEPPQLDGVAGGLRGLIEACLLKNPADRPTPSGVLARLAALGTNTVTTAPTLEEPDRTGTSAGAAAVADLPTESRAPRPGPVQVATPTLRADAELPVPAAGPTSARSAVRRRALVLAAFGVLGTASIPVLALWPRSQPKPPATAVTDLGTVSSMALSPDGKTLATGGVNWVHLWSVATGAMTGAIVNSLFEIAALAYSPDGKTLAGGSPSCVELWDAADGSHLNTLTWVSSTAVAFSPDGTTLAGSGVGGVRLWDAATHRTIATLTDTMTNSIAFSPDGRTLARSGGSALSPGRAGSGIQLINTATRRVTATLTSDPTASVAFSPDGRTLASCGVGGARLWDTATHRTTATVSSDSTSSLAFSPDRKTLAVGGAHSPLRLWDLTTRTPAAVLSNGASSMLAFSRDGATLASIGGYAADQIRLTKPY